MTSSQIAVQKGKRLLGQPIKRMEDQKFITGSGKFLDDIRFPNMLFAAFVRSPHAHAKILKVDATAALRSPGVVGAFTGRDIDGLVENMPSVDDEGGEAGG